MSLFSASKSPIKLGGESMNGIINSNSLAYASGELGLSLITNLLDFFKIKVFLTIFDISSGWYQTAQLIAILWTTVVSLLVSFLQDSLWLSRSRSLLVAAPFFVATFCLYWFHWLSSFNIGIQLILTDCIFYIFERMIRFSHSSLLVEMSRAYTQRLSQLCLAQLPYIVSCFAIPMANYYSLNLTKYTHFQQICLIIALISFVSIILCGRYSSTLYDKADSHCSTECHSTPSLSYSSHIWLYMKQLFTNPLFICILLAKFSHNFHMGFINSFLPIITDEIFSILTVSQRSLFYYVCQVSPAIVFMIAYPIVRQLKVATVATVLTAFTVFTSLCMFCVITFLSHYQILTIYLLLDHVIVGFMCNVLSLAVTEVTDSDRLLHNRSRPISALVVSLYYVLASKAFNIQSMVTVGLLQSYGYDASLKKQPPNVHSLLLHMITLIPFMTATFECAIWFIYRRTQRNST